MQPSVDYIKASDGVADASLMTVSTVRAPLASTILVNTVANVPDKFFGSMGTPHTFTDPITGETITVISEATAVDFAGHVDGSNLEIDEIAPGYTDNGSEVGDIVIIRPTTQWSNNLGDVVKEQTINPTGMIAPFAGASAPDFWLMCNGASLLRADYADLFAIIGTTYGSVDGTHFNVPDLRSRSPVGVGTGTFSFTFAAADVNTSNEQITVTANEELITGRKVQIANPGTLPTGISAATDYYIIKVDSTHIQLATSVANAVAGTAVNITAQGSGTNTATGALTARTLGQKGGEESHATTLAESPAHTHNTSTGFTAVPTASPTTNVWNGNAGAGFTVSTDSRGSSAAHNNMQPFLALNYIIKT